MARVAKRRVLNQLSAMRGQWVGGTYWWAGVEEEREEQEERMRRARRKFRIGGAKGKEEKYNVTLSGLGAGCEENQRHLWGAGRWQWKCWKSSVHDYKKWRNLLSLSSWKPTPGLLWKPCSTITDDTAGEGGGGVVGGGGGRGEEEGKETHH